MSTEATWTINYGQVRIREDSIWKVVDHDDVKIWLVDLDTKRPVITYGTTYYPDDAVEYSITFLVDEETLYIDDTTEEFTELRLAGFDEDWVLMVDGSKYEVRIVMFRFPPTSTNVRGSDE